MAISIGIWDAFARGEDAGPHRVRVSVLSTVKDLVKCRVGEAQLDRCEDFKELFPNAAHPPQSQYSQICQTLRILLRDTYHNFRECTTIEGEAFDKLNNIRFEMGMDGETAEVKLVIQGYEGVLGNGFPKGPALFTIRHMLPQVEGLGQRTVKYQPHPFQYQIFRHHSRR
ncbi:hypothetical protein AC579_1115 [Pseudocercospora musae]|uniref:Uncharacterized protein n=1 Tax=Pseudocercospora musae TaxID=113226 RepID=A0A139HZS5_9PEZI|nr:hypothetical protein AC579_1115 [Pseudocercospora musae]